MTFTKVLKYMMILAIPLTILVVINPSMFEFKRDAGPKSLEVTFEGLSDEGDLRFKYNNVIFLGPMIPPGDEKKLPTKGADLKVVVKPLKGGSCFMYFISEKGQSTNYYESDLDCFEIYSE